MDYSQEQGFFEITQVLEKYSSVPSGSPSVKVSIVEEEAVVSITLPSESKTGPLFEFREVELSYKRSAFLAQSKQILVDLQQQPPVDGVVVVKITDLSPGTNYQCKVRVSNNNGFGSWSKNTDFALEESSESESESESESDSKESKDSKEKKVKLSKKQPKSPRKVESSSSESETEDDSEPSEEEKPVKETKEEVKSLKKQLTPKETEPKPEPRVEVKSDPVPVITPVKEETPIQVNQEQPTEPSPLPVEPQVPTLTPEDVVRMVTEGRVEELSKVDSTLLQTIPNHLPLVHTAILSRQSTKTIREVLKVLSAAKCSLTEEVKTVLFSSLFNLIGILLSTYSSSLFMPSFRFYCS